jgi:hypothetical protein
MLNHLENHWKGWFVGISGSLFLISMFLGWGLGNIAFSGLLFGSAIITVNDGWSVFWEKVGKGIEGVFSGLCIIAGKILEGYGTLLFGKGITSFLFTGGFTLFLSSIFGAMTIIGTENGVMIGTAGVAMIFAGFMSIPAKKIYRESSSTEKEEEK